MDYSEFVTVIGAPKEPEINDFQRVTMFAHGAEKHELWAAMGIPNIHPIYRSVLAQALQRRMIEEMELEQTRKRKIEEDARLAASQDELTKDAHEIQEHAPRRRMR